MKTKHIVTPIIICIFILGIIGCNKDKLDPVCSNSVQATYTNEIKPIIDATCALSGCHNTGSNVGVFTTYEGLEPYLSDGHFKHHVIKKQDMPKGFKLTQDQINLIQCWINNDYAE